MTSNGTGQIESTSIREFAQAMEQPRPLRPRGLARLDVDPDQMKNGLAQLVLSLIKLLHELMERQALRRIDAGSLTEAQIERLGLTLMRQAEEIERLRAEFGLDAEDLNLDLGPLGKLF